MLSSPSLRSSSYPLRPPFRTLETLNPTKTLAGVSANLKRRPSGSPAPAASLLGSVRRVPIPASRVAAESDIPAIAPPQISSASDVVRGFYDGINRRDLASVELLIGEGCVYEDLVFSRPFVGRKCSGLIHQHVYASHYPNPACILSVVLPELFTTRGGIMPLALCNLSDTAILEFFKKFTESTSQDLQFVIDDISSDDTSAVGVTWHLDWQGRPFPFSKGCSFYRLEVLDGKRQIVYGRDCVEPATKPGEMTLCTSQIKTATYQTVVSYTTLNYGANGTFLDRREGNGYNYVCILVVNPTVSPSGGRRIEYWDIFFNLRACLYLVNRLSSKVNGLKFYLAAVWI